MSKLVLSSFLVALLVAVNGDDVTRQAVAVLSSRIPGSNENIHGNFVFTEIEEGLRVIGMLTGLPFGRYSVHVHLLGDIRSCDGPGTYFNSENMNHGGSNFTVSPVFSDSPVAEFEARLINGTVILDFNDTAITLRGKNNILGRALVLHQLELDEYQIQPPVVGPPDVVPPVVPPPVEQPPAGGAQPPAEQPPTGVIPPAVEQPPTGGAQPPAEQPPAEVVPPPALPPPVEQPPTGGAQPPAVGVPGQPNTFNTANPVVRVACGTIAILYPSDPWLSDSAVTSSPSLLLFIVSMLVTFFHFSK